MVTVLDDGKTDFNCWPSSPSQSYGNKGVTIWGPLTNEITLTHNGGTWTGHFVPTRPQGFVGTTDANLTFEIHTEDTSNSYEVGPIDWEFTTNRYIGETLYALSSGVNHGHHSKIGGHDATETHDIWQSRDLNVTVNSEHPRIFNESGQNTITFTNNDPQVDVYIRGLQIVRGYDMTALGSSGASEIPQAAGSDSLGSTRQDFPCNYGKCGGRSFTTYAPANNNGPKLVPGVTYTWEWTNPNATFNGNDTYIGRWHTLFNFNNIALCNDDGEVFDDPNDQDFQRASTNDIEISLSLDNEHWARFYHCKSNYHMAHGVDLATHSILKNYYDDSPNGGNTLYFKITNNPGINLKLMDGIGLVNLYRFYKTNGCCESLCQGCLGCESCYFGENCPICVGFCLTCVTPCELCESGYDWNELYGFNWPCTELCETCYLPCYSCQPCETCQPCEGCQTCEVCQPCENCQSGCLTCEPGCYDCQSCYNCEPNCYDFQICYLCQGNCYDCESCYVTY